jgi:hypothetical protein
VLVGDHEPRDAVLDDLGRGTLRERDHRRPAGECLDHHQPERLGPADRHQQRAGALVEVALALRVGLADVLHAVAAELRLELLGEERLLARLHRPGEHHRRAGLAGRGDRALRPLVGRHPADPEQEVLLLRAEWPLGAIDRVVHDLAAAHLLRRGVELRLRDRHDLRLAAVARVEAARRAVERAVQRMH